MLLLHLLHGTTGTTPTTGNTPTTCTAPATVTTPVHVQHVHLGGMPRTY